MLIELAQLKQLLERQQVQVIDIRPGPAYRRGHIPGALHVPELFDYLAQTTADGLQRLHSYFQHHLSQRGVRNDLPLVIYEDSLETWHGGSCRGYWLLTYLGHRDVRVLERGFLGWRHQGYAVTTSESHPPPSTFTVQPQAQMLASHDDMLAQLHHPTAKLVDNRDQDEWRGESSSPYGVDFAPRKGRIPGAIWVEWYRLMEQHLEYSTFRSPEQIRTICQQEGLQPDDEIILYCFKGARSANTWVALRLAGFNNVRLYLGSWNEWSRDFSLPVDQNTVS